MYTARQLADFFGLSPRTINYYVVKGVCPKPLRSGGPGTLYPVGAYEAIRDFRKALERNTTAVDYAERRRIALESLAAYGD